MIGFAISFGGISGDSDSSGSTDSSDSSESSDSSSFWRLIFAGDSLLGNQSESESSKTSSITSLTTSYSSYFFHYCFCATAATIVSGALAERCRIEAYACFSIYMGAIIYPFVVRWCWTEEGFLYQLGYRDFAGSGVVHLVGGTSAFVGAYILGPRDGRFPMETDSVDQDQDQVLVEEIDQICNLKQQQGTKELDHGTNFNLDQAKLKAVTVPNSKFESLKLDDLDVQLDSVDQNQTSNDQQSTIMVAGAHAASPESESQQKQSEQQNSSQQIQQQTINQQYQNARISAQSWQSSDSGDTYFQFFPVSSNSIPVPFVGPDSQGQITVSDQNTDAKQLNPTLSCKAQVDTKQMLDESESATQQQCDKTVTVQQQEQYQNNELSQKKIQLPSGHDIDVTNTSDTNLNSTSVKQSATVMTLKNLLPLSLYNSQSSKSTTTSANRNLRKNHQSNSKSQQYQQRRTQQHSSSYKQKSSSRSASHQWGAGFISSKYNQQMLAFRLPIIKEDRSPTATERSLNLSNQNDTSEKAQPQAPVIKPAQNNNKSDSSTAVTAQSVESVINNGPGQGPGQSHVKSHSINSAMSVTVQTVPTTSRASTQCQIQTSNFNKTQQQQVQDQYQRHFNSTSNLNMVPVSVYSPKIPTQAVHMMLSPLSCSPMRPGGPSLIEIQIARRKNKDLDNHKNNSFNNNLNQQQQYINKGCLNNADGNESDSILEHKIENLKQHDSIDSSMQLDKQQQSVETDNDQTAAAIDQEYFCPEDFLEAISVLTMSIGCFILWFAWFGFNCGSTRSLTSGEDIIRAGRAAVNTAVSGSVGGLTACFAATKWQNYLIYRHCKRLNLVNNNSNIDNLNLNSEDSQQQQFDTLSKFTRYDVSAFCNGILAGCVSVTGSCDNVQPWSAVILGSIGGILMIAGATFQERLRLDDPISAWPVHGVNGFWGVIGRGLFDIDHGFICGQKFGNEDGNDSNRFSKLLGPQIVSGIFIIGWTALSSGALFMILRYYNILRLPNEVYDKQNPLIHNYITAFNRTQQGQNLVSDKNNGIKSQLSDGNIGNATVNHNVTSAAASAATSASSTAEDLDHVTEKPQHSKSQICQNHENFQKQVSEQLSDHHPGPDVVSQVSQSQSQTGQTQQKCQNLMQQKLETAVQAANAAVAAVNAIAELNQINQTQCGPIQQSNTNSNQNPVNRQQQLNDSEICDSRLSSKESQFKLVNATVGPGVEQHLSGLNSGEQPTSCIDSTPTDFNKIINSTQPCDSSVTGNPNEKLLYPSEIQSLSHHEKSENENSISQNENSQNESHDSDEYTNNSNSNSNSFSRPDSHPPSEASKTTNETVGMAMLFRNRVQNRLG